MLRIIRGDSFEIGASTSPVAVMLFLDPVSVRFTNFSSMTNLASSVLCTSFVLSKPLLAAQAKLLSAICLGYGSA